MRKDIVTGLWVTGYGLSCYALGGTTVINVYWALVLVSVIVFGFGASWRIIHFTIKRA